MQKMPDGEKKRFRRKLLDVISALFALFDVTLVRLV